MSRRRHLFGAMAAALLVLAAIVTVQNGDLAATARADTNTAAATAGCGKPPALRSGNITIQSSGKNRNYVLRVPDNYDQTRPYRVVFGFHWLNGTASDVASGWTVEQDVWAYYGLLRLANNSTIFVAPQGFNNGWANRNGEDITFVDDIVRQLDAGLCIDTTQRFATGFSYGGAMSYSVACSRPTVFRAVAVLSGGVLSGCSGGTQPIAYLGIHGLRDSVLTIAGGRSMRDRFVRNNGCTAQNPPEPSQGSLTHQGTTYSGCRAGYPVRWVAFDAGHIAAPHDGSTGDSGRTWAPAETWQFFTQFQSTQPGPRSEAETAPAVCQGTIDSNHAGFSGTGFCNGSAAVGAYAQFTVNTTAAATATVAVRFANGASSGATRPANLIVNGSTVATASFEPTGTWTAWTTKTLTIPLNAGNNTIRLDPTTADGLPNIDYLEIS